jgi:hypothetical protein
VSSKRPATAGAALSGQRTGLAGSAPAVKVVNGTGSLSPARALLVPPSAQAHVTHIAWCARVPRPCPPSQTSSGWACGRLTWTDSTSLSRSASPTCTAALRAHPGSALLLGLRGCLYPPASPVSSDACALPAAPRRPAQCRLPMTEEDIKTGRRLVSARTGSAAHAPARTCAHGRGPTLPRQVGVSRLTIPGPSLAACCAARGGVGQVQPRVGDGA